MIGKTVFLIALSILSGSSDVFGEGQETPAPDVKTRQMEFAGPAKPFTDKFLQSINENSEAFRSLFAFANYQSQLGDNPDEQEVAVDHCKLIHRSEATELMLEVGLIFQEMCLDEVKELSPLIDKTVADFLAEMKDSSEVAHEEALGCSKSDKKGPELLLECLRSVVDDHYLPLHSYLDTLAEMYAKMVEIIKSLEECESNVIEIIENKIKKLIEEKVVLKCAKRTETIANDLDLLSVEEAVSYYLETMRLLREGVKNQMDVVLTRRPLRTMIKVIGKFLENEAQKMSDEIHKRIEAIESLHSKFADCISDVPAELTTFLEDSLTKLSYCGVSVSNLQYEFDVGLSALAEEAVGVFASLNENAIRETCTLDVGNDVENVKCIKNVLLSEVSDIIVPIESSVSEFLYAQFLKYTNMEAHLTVKNCISEITSDMNDETVNALKAIQECIDDGQGNVDADKDEL